jgi:pyruvyltransferase
MSNLNISWWGNNGNWGDELNRVLCSRISDMNINRVDILDKSSTFRYYCIGSVLQTPLSDNFEVWGSGLISERSRMPFKPNKIHSVRGPLTREILLNQGIECPEIYGDPALLYPIFYKPKSTKKYKYGIIPHYIDHSSSWISKFENNNDIKIINIKDFTINRFVDEINECEIILSSSLHGIIAGDSYGIPSYWIELSKSVQGDGFKFNDYFSSVKRPLISPIIPNYISKIEDISSQLYDYNVKISLNDIINSCPFKSNNLIYNNHQIL